MKELPAPFLKMVQDDIKRISESLTESNQKQWHLFCELDGRYQACVKDWYKSMQGANHTESGLRLDRIREYPEYTTKNLMLIKSKLETFQYGMNAVSLPEPPATQVTVTTNVGINITFEEVRSQVREMTGLDSEQTQEALDKINEIEQVVKSTDSKKSKWEKVKPILKWLADKSCDVGIALLPLILQIQS